MDIQQGGTICQTVNIFAMSVLNTFIEGNLYEIVCTGVFAALYPISENIL